MLAINKAEEGNLKGRGENRKVEKAEKQKSSKGKGDGLNRWGKQNYHEYQLMYFTV